MSDKLRFDGRVAIVTGAGGGLGRAHALLLASRGAAVIVNDLGGSVSGEGASQSAAQKVVNEIKTAGGEAVANFDSVENGEAIVQTAIDKYKRLDIVINNAGILRDVSFHKMTDQDWDLIYRVHVLGSYKVTKAAWPILREAQYGRVIMTTSSSGIYGNFGQANYSMAKLGLLGLAKTLAHEGQPKNVFVNSVAPMAGSRMTETVLPKELVEQLKPEFVSPVVAWLCHEDCTENGGLFEVGAGFVGKLRWERTKGAKFHLGRGFTVDDVQKKWQEICDFSGATHPGNPQESMVPAIENLATLKQTAPVGNENIQPDKLVGAKFDPATLHYNERDLSLYALGIGMAHHGPRDARELQYVYEAAGNGFKAFPTYAVIFPFGTLTKLTNMEGIKFNPMMLLHGEQTLEVPRPLAPEATITTEGKITHVYDKIKGAVIVTESISRDEKGELVARNEGKVFIRGLGNFGGDRGPSGNINEAPGRAPDAVEEEKTDENQALIYRLSGDRNPLHADPAMAAMGGFDQPILHGLCFFGFAARHVLKRFADYDAARFKSITVRFARHVFPGETLVTEMWKESETKILFRCKAKERDEVVITNGAVELQPVAAAKSGNGSIAASSASPAVTAIFDEISKRIAAKPELLQKIGAVFQFDVAGAGAWWVDLKTAPGGVHPGTAEKPNCTIAMATEDFVGLMTGKLNGQQAFMQGKLKVKGDIMLATKLSLLQG
jgi:3-hydroxyacyl-CoA dehydrogenase/3a,7a,12a-trihydroxy-5b-cholest-24-enoyl-CoA hydratase